jgi:ankyrin repeat protein
MTSGVYNGEEDDEGNNIYHGRLDHVEFLSKSSGYDINWRNDAGFTPIMYALKYGHTDIAEHMLTQTAATIALDDSDWLMEKKQNIRGYLKRKNFMKVIHIKNKANGDNNDGPRFYNRRFGRVHDLGGVQWRGGQRG